MFTRGFLSEAIGQFSGEGVVLMQVTKAARFLGALIQLQQAALLVRHAVRQFCQSLLGKVQRLGVETVDRGIVMRQPGIDRTLQVTGGTRSDLSRLFQYRHRPATAGQLPGRMCTRQTGTNNNGRAVFR